MSTVSADEKRYFLISIAKGRLSEDVSLDEARTYWYCRPNYNGVYDAVVKIAFTTLARTVRGFQRNLQRNAIKAEATTYLISQLKSLQVTSQGEFDAWHKETSDELINIFAKCKQDFTVGQSQKWINMTLKHLALADDTSTDSYYAFCHVPIDSYIIKGLKSNLVPKALSQIDTSFGQDDHKVAAWSRIDDYDKYLKFQEDFRNLCGEIPLDYEFHLWQKQKDSI